MEIRGRVIGLGGRFLCEEKIYGQQQEYIVWIMTGCPVGVSVVVYV